MANEPSTKPKIILKVKVDNILQMISNKVTSWSNTPSDDNYPSEKLVKDSLDGKVSIGDLDNGLQNIGGWTIHTPYNVSGSTSAYSVSSGLIYTQQSPVYFLVKNNIGDNEANATLQYYPNGNNIPIMDTFSTNYSPIQQGVWKKDTWALFFCQGNSTVQLKCIFYDSVDINKIMHILGIENLSYYVVLSVSKDKRVTYNVNDSAIFDGNSFYLKVPYYETSTDIKVTLKTNSAYIMQGSNYVTESQVNGHLLKLRFDSGRFQILEIYDNDKLIPLFSDLSTVATTGSYNDLSNKPTIPTVPTNISSFNNDSGYLTAHQDITGKEDKSNKVTSLSSSSTDTEYPSAKAVYGSLANYVQKSNTVGLVKNDGTIDTTSYSTFDGGIENTDLFDVLQCVIDNFDDFNGYIFYDSGVTGTKNTNFIFNGITTSCQVTTDANGTVFLYTRSGNGMYIPNIDISQYANLEISWIFTYGTRYACQTTLLNSNKTSPNDVRWHNAGTSTPTNQWYTPDGSNSITHTLTVGDTMKLVKTNNTFSFYCNDELISTVTPSFTVAYIGFTSADNNRPFGYKELKIAEAL